MIQLLTFEEAIKQSVEQSKIKNQNPTLLLGNGFSMSIFPQIFSYKSLLERSKEEKLFPDTSSSVLKLFESLKTVDFEKIMNLLTNTSLVLPQYVNDEQLIIKILNDAAELKQILVEAISRNHPSSPDAISESQYLSCKRFLSNFKAVFTLNYDLLLYWVVMKYLDQFKLYDGFDDPHSDDEEENYVREPYVSWDNDSSHSITLGYLHGALHLYDAKHELRKHCFSRTGVRLKDQIISAMEKGSYPLFVAEGDYLSKEGRIYNNGYLSKVMRSFKETNGDLFVYGVGFKDNDSHIKNRIINSSIQNLYVGIYGDPNSLENQQLIGELNRIKERRQRLIERKKRKNALAVHFYDAKTAKIWDFA